MKYLKLITSLLAFIIGIYFTIAGDYTNALISMIIVMLGGENNDI